MILYFIVLDCTRYELCDRSVLYGMRYYHQMQVMSVTCICLYWNMYNYEFDAIMRLFFWGTSQAHLLAMFPGSHERASPYSHRKDIVVKTFGIQNESSVLSN